jgi:YVTN family beta-propeller protein
MRAGSPRRVGVPRGPRQRSAGTTEPLGAPSWLDTAQLKPDQPGHHDLLLDSAIHRRAFAPTRLAYSRGLRMADLPSGVVTFLFTDIEGSTRLVKQFRERWGEVVGEHQRLLRGAFANHRGHEVDTQGDSFFVVFPRARDAVLAAVEGQRALLSHPWPDGAQLKVRMGIHTGQAAATDGRYTGLAVHRAARIGAAGHGGQVLVSQATQTLLEDEEEDLGISLGDLGEQRLKDLDRPVRLYQVGAEGLPAEFPPLRYEAELAQAAEAVLAAPSRRRRWFLLGGAGSVVAAAVAAAVVLLAEGGGAITVRPNAVGVINPGSNKVVDQVPVGARPSAITPGASSIWVANVEDRTLARIDPFGRSLRRYITLQRTPTDAAYGEGAVWVANGLLGTVQRVDTDFNTVGDPIDTGAGRAGDGSIAVGGGTVWFASGNSIVVGVDPASGRVTHALFARAGPAAVSVGFGSVWVANQDDNTLSRFDADTGALLKTFTVGRRPSGIAVGGGAVWVTDEGDDRVSRIDPASNSQITIDVGDGPTGIAFGLGAVWVANSRDGTVSRIDPDTNLVTAKAHVGNRPQGVAVAGGVVWVSVRATASG